MDLSRVTIACGCGERLQASFKVQLESLRGRHHGMSCPGCRHWHALPDAPFEVRRWTSGGWTMIESGLKLGAG